jgi:isoamylase
MTALSMFRRRISGFLVAAAIVSVPTLLRAQIDHLHLGSQFDASGSASSFRVYSSCATRIELYLYSRPTDADEVAHIPLDRDAATSVWSTTVPLSRIRGEFRIAGAIYYGSRAWGPNWPFDTTWIKGSKAGFITDVDKAATASIRPSFSSILTHTS